jgi:hypothetical protein
MLLLLLMLLALFLCDPDCGRCGCAEDWKHRCCHQSPDITIHVIQFDNRDLQRMCYVVVSGLYSAHCGWFALQDLQVTREQLLEK